MRVTTTEQRVLILKDVLEKPHSTTTDLMNWSHAHIGQYNVRKFTPADLAVWDDNQFGLFLKMILMGKDNDQLSGAMEEELEEYGLK